MVKTSGNQLILTKVSAVAFKESDKLKRHAPLGALPQSTAFPCVAP